ncbi:DUF1493 family protein [Enterobacillus tribolii]|uniref:Uncharacterized protein DUF1493 n=1 Tax=Enterobacillus tribolii TaxID=1487935 RepID=A0A370R513_9GAMM|nr:DUF1493 family protein [Enterobacillus tribolii]MBW7983437.1 DUF1493 family protein [Enterobacillus tribolii]RDK97496.1 uncharacterized protein DUF1493 [Enterobacillus tribolii]
MDVLLNIEQEILEYVQKNCGRRKYLFWGKLLPIDIDSDLRVDLQLIYEDAIDFFGFYFENWKVDIAGFTIDRYFEPEFLGSPAPKQPLEPITVLMMVESAAAGRWLY